MAPVMFSVKARIFSDQNSVFSESRISVTRVLFSVKAEFLVTRILFSLKAEFL